MMKMNGITELYENHQKHQYKQPLEHKMLLDNNINATITPTTAMRMNGLKPHITTTTTAAAAATKIQNDDEERKNQNRNLAKINWWNTPFKPLTMETIVDQQSQQQQLQQQQVEDQIISDPNKDESASVYLLDEEKDHAQQQQEQELENENFNERKEERDSLMSNGKFT